VVDKLTGPTVIPFERRVRSLANQAGHHLRTIDA
jgi:hypothetical protein